MRERVGIFALFTMRVYIFIPVPRGGRERGERECREGERSERGERGRGECGEWLCLMAGRCFGYVL